MIIANVISSLMGSTQSNVIRLMKSQFTRARGGNRLPHSTTGQTAESFKADMPFVSSVMMTWDFKANDSAVRLNNGGSKFARKSTDVPYGAFSDPGGESQYISALIKWVKRKYRLNDIMAKKMAFAVAQSASNRGTVVKAAGWFNEIESQVFKQIMSDISSIIMIEVNSQINKQLKI
jgi:hypothetical protein